MSPIPVTPACPAARGVREVAQRQARISAIGLLAIGLLGSVPAQDDAIERMVTADAARWIRHDDPIVRGEVALVLAARSDPAHHADIIAIARDSDDRARLRGLLALGMQATPGVVQVLDEILTEQRGRTDAAGLCAAYALGSLPPDHSPAVVARVLTSFLDANWKRQGDVLLALLFGMSRHEQHNQVFALRQLYGERANRDPVIRAMLLELLLPHDATDAEKALDLLERAGEHERLVLLRWLARNATDFDSELLRPIERLATSGRRPVIRAEALAVLTRMRHPPAIEIAAKALRSRHPVEVEQGMRSALSIGGASMRLALEGHLRDAEDATLKAAMLRSWAAPPSAELTDHCAELASDKAQPFELRVAAVTMLSQSDSRRASPLLRDLVRLATSYDHLRRLSHAIVAHAEPMPQLDRLLPDPSDVALHPTHWRALLAAAHPGATRHLLEVLAMTEPPTHELRSALTAWRRPMVIGRLPHGGRDLPDPLREVLMPAAR